MKRRWEIRPGTYDERVFDEVWNEDTYRLTTPKALSWPVDFSKAPVLDIGANVGAFTLRALDLHAPHVCSVEAHPDNVTQLRRNLDLCGVADRVAIVAAAVHNATGTVRMSGRYGQTEGDDLTGTHFAADGEIEVPTVPFRALLEGAAAWSCLKMDIEGGEFEAWKGITAADIAHVEHIVMEFHGPGMPHLTHLAAGQFGGIVETIAEWGHVTLLGRPSVGGQLYGKRY